MDRIKFTDGLKVIEVSGGGGVEECFERIGEIMEDRRHGSSWILLQTIKLLKRIKPENRAEVCGRISSSHPAMAGLKALYTAITENPLMDPEKVVVEANEKTSKNLEKLVAGKTVTTISRSHIVEKGLLKASKVIVLESLPGGEGKETAAWLEKQREFKGLTRIVPDALMGYALRESELVVVGADSISFSAFLNKVGTLPLALTSNHLARPFVVVSPSYKFSENLEWEVEWKMEWEVERKSSDPLFEAVSMELVDFVVWEEGTVDLKENDLHGIAKSSKNFFRRG